MHNGGAGYRPGLGNARVGSGATLEMAVSDVMALSPAGRRTSLLLKSESESSDESDESVREKSRRSLHEAVRCCRAVHAVGGVECEV